jgi:hypothetical protein
MPMCSVCGDWEAGKELNSTEFCSQMCEDHTRARRYKSAGTGWVDDIMQSQYDDDPSPYSGTYSED